MAIRRLGQQPGLDGVRAFAIVAVMGLHAIARLFPGGFLGVDVFFVLSAFLITSLILRELDAARGRFDFAGFYFRRAFRLGPALILWLALLALPTALLLGNAGSIPAWTLGSLFYVGDFMAAGGVPGGDAYTHVWSLAIEEQFYAVWPATLVILWSIRRRLRPRWVWVTVLVAAVVLIETLADVGLPENYFLPTGHLVPLAAGIAAAVIFAKAEHGRLEAAVGPRALGLLALAVLAVLVVGEGVLVRAGAETLQVLAAVAAGYLILHVTVRSASPARWLLTLPPVMWLGRRSYGLYLYHRTLAITVPLLWPGIPLRIAGPLVVAISLLLAEVSFRLVEYPIQRRGRAWLVSRGERARTGEPTLQSR